MVPQKFQNPANFKVRRIDKLSATVPVVQLLKLLLPNSDT